MNDWPDDRTCQTAGQEAGLPNERALADRIQELKRRLSESQITIHSLSPEEQKLFPGVKKKKPGLAPQAFEMYFKNEHSLDQNGKCCQVGSWVWDLGSGKLTCSPALYPIFGFTAPDDELAYADFLERVHPADREQIRCQAAEAILALQPFNLQFRALWPEGQIHLLKVLGDVIAGPGGELLQVIGTVEDITGQLQQELAVIRKQTIDQAELLQSLKTELEDRQQSEMTMRISNTILEGLFESAADAILLVDEGGFIRQANRKTMDMFGYPLDELVGKPVEVLIPGRLRHRHRLQRSGYNANPQSRPMAVGLDLKGLHKDGYELPVDITLSPMYLETELHVVCVVRDIRQRKEREAELVEVRSRLLDSLESERLFLSQELHDGVIQDLYGLSYQMKALQNNLASQVAGDGFGAFQESLTDIVRDLRAICENLRPPTLEDYGLEKAIRSHAGRFQADHPEFEISLELSPDGGALPERIRLALFRIYQSALANILRHARARKVWIRLLLDAEQIVMEVQDDGSGFRIPDSWIGFVRAGHLGLAGMEERARAIGGRLDVITSPGQGTTVRMTVPISDNGAYPW